MSAEAQRLKDEGNTLYINKNFAGAYEKYTQAIRHDDKNAILYCNRAACSLALKRFMDASADGKKAVQLDPNYAKAWARLAIADNALHRPDLAVEDWKRALSALPTESLTPAQEKQREQYKRELATAEAKLSVPTQSQAAVIENAQGKMPWNRAAAILPGLAVHGIWDSSAWIVDYAHSVWNRAYANLMEGRIIQTPLGLSYRGSVGVIEGLSNAVMADTRIFHVSDNNFIDQYNKQMSFELVARNAGSWADGGPKRVMEELPERLNAHGWRSVRPALSLTVRGWILRAIVESGIKASPETALEFIMSALEVLVWARERFRDVPDEDRGAVFQPTFIRGVKCLRLGMLMTAYSKHPGSDSPYPLKDLLASADEILAELGEIPMQPHMEPIGFYHAFFRYPAGQAHAIRAFCYRNLGLQVHEAQGMTEEVCELFRKAGLEYMEAVKYYPMDDEQCASFIHSAFMAHGTAGAPLKYLLLLLDQLDKSMTLMKKIWEYSADALDGRDAQIQKAMTQRQAWLDDIQMGQASEDDIVHWQMNV